MPRHVVLLMAFLAIAGTFKDVNAIRTDTDAILHGLVDTIGATGEHKDNQKHGTGGACGLRSFEQLVKGASERLEFQQCSNHFRDNVNVGSAYRHAKGQPAQVMKDALRAVFHDQEAFEPFFAKNRALIFTDEEKQCPSQIPPTGLDAVMMSGGPGAGKGASIPHIERMLGGEFEHYVTLDTDKVRENLEEYQNMLCLRKDRSGKCFGWEGAHSDCLILGLWLHEIFAAEAFRDAPRCNVLIDRVRIDHGDFDKLVSSEWNYNVAIVAVYADVEDSLQGIHRRFKNTCRNVPESFVRQSYQEMDQALCDYDELYAEHAKLGVYLIQGPKFDPRTGQKVLDTMEFFSVAHNGDHPFCEHQYLREWDMLDHGYPCLTMKHCAFSEHDGGIPAAQGGTSLDLGTAEVTVEHAKYMCRKDRRCAGFSFSGPTRDGVVEVFFKSRWATPRVSDVQWTTWRNEMHAWHIWRQDPEQFANHTQDIRRQPSGPQRQTSGSKHREDDDRRQTSGPKRQTSGSKRTEVDSPKGGPGQQAVRELINQGLNAGKFGAIMRQNRLPNRGRSAPTKENEDSGAQTAQFGGGMEELIKYMAQGTVQGAVQEAKERVQGQLPKSPIKLPPIEPKRQTKPQLRRKGGETNDSRHPKRQKPSGSDSDSG